MKNLNLLTLSFILTILLSSCGLASVSGPVVEETINLDTYTKIEVGYAIHVTINEGDIKVKAVDVEMSGTSDAKLFGSTENLTVDGSGASKFNGKGFTTASLSTELSGASNAYINITKEIRKADLSGASDFVFTGKNITFGDDIDFSGAADIERVDSF